MKMIFSVGRVRRPAIYEDDFFGGERTAFTLDFSHRFLTYKMKKDRKYAL